MSLHDFLKNPPAWVVVLVVLFVFCQGIWIFRDAQKRGRFPWLWGIWGMSNFPLPLIVYYFAVIRRDRKGLEDA
jgi:hypothetical protein